MKKTDALPLRDILQESLRNLNIEDKIHESRLVEWWPAVVGTTIAGHTLSTTIVRKVLYVKLDTPILRNELQMMRQNLLEQLNKASGQPNTITDIVFR